MIHICRQYKIIFFFYKLKKPFVCAVIHVERGGGSRKVTFNAFYPVGCAARRFDDKRKLPHLLLHGGGQFVLGVLFDYRIHSAREQPAGRGSPERAHAVPIAGSSGNGSGCAAYRNLLRRVIDIETVCARFEQVVYAVCRAVERGRVVGCLHRVGCRDVNVRAPPRPVGGKGYRAVVGMRCVVDRVFHVATYCQQ